MMRGKSLRQREHGFLPEMVLMITFVISVFVTHRVTANFLDADAASEMVLAKHWIDTGDILSGDWLYGAEIRLIHMQLVFAPLLLVFDDWQLVRFLGTVILQAIYVLSFGFLIRQAGLGRKVFYYGASLLLLPASVGYGRIVLYHCHYLPNIALSFWIVGLTLGFSKEVDRKAPETWIRLAALAALSLLGGVNSIRQLMITHVPLLFVVFLLLLVSDKNAKQEDRPAVLSKLHFQLLLVCVFSAACSFLGLKINAYLLANGLDTRVHSTANVLHFIEAADLPKLLYGFFHQFGYRDYVEMLSVTGILSLGGIFAAIYCVCRSLRKLLHYRASGDIRRELLSGMFLGYTVVMLTVLFVSGGIERLYYYPLYLSLCFPWAVPMLLEDREQLSRTYQPLHMQRLLSLVTLLVLIANGLVNMAYYCGSDRFFQNYEGLGFQEKDKKASITQLVDFLLENGYDKGYATYWEGNIITEVSNGQIPVVNLYCPAADKDNPANLVYYDALTSVWNRESPCEKPFLVMHVSYREDFKGTDSYQYCTEIYSDSDQTVYSIDNLEAFIPTLYS